MTPRPRRPVRCPSCGDDNVPPARFCGRCGGRLTADTPTMPARPVTPRAVAVATAAVVAITMVVGAASIDRVAAHDGRWIPAVGGDVTAPSDAVVVGPAASAASGPPVRTSCAPSACAVWWRQDRPLRSSRVAVAGGLLAVAHGDRVTAIDAVTGEEQWTTPVHGLLGHTLAPSLHVTVAADHDAVVVTTPDHTVLLDRHDGAPRWTTRTVGWQVWAASLLDDRVVVRTRTGRGGSPLPRLEALDRATGEAVWEQVVAEVVDIADAAITTRSADGTVVVIDPRDGRVRPGASIAAATAAPDDRHPRADRVLVTTRHDPATGEAVLTTRTHDGRISQVAGRRIEVVSIDPLVALVDDVLLGVDPWQATTPPAAVSR